MERKKSPLHALDQKVSLSERTGVNLAERYSSAIGDSAHVMVKTPKGWYFQCQVEGSHRNGDTWEIPPGTRVLDGRFVNNGITVPVSVRIPRAGIELTINRRNTRIIWKQDLREEGSIDIEGLAGATCQLEIASAGNRLSLGPAQLPRNKSSKRFSVMTFRDALEMCGLAAGEFELFFDGHSRIKTRRYFASAERICKKLLDLADDSAVFRLPTLGTILREIRMACEGPVPYLSVRAAFVENPLRTFICDLALTALAIDKTVTDASEEEVRTYASPSVVEIMQWYREACDAYETSAGTSDILKKYDQLQLSVIYSQRWREAIDRARRSILDSDIAEIVKEWRDSVLQHPHGNPKSIIASKLGGRELTQAAQRYLLASRQEGPTRQNLYAEVCGGLNYLLTSGLADPLVKSIARGLLQLGYYRSNRNDMVRDTEVTGLPPSLQKMRCSMKALANQFGAQHQPEAWANGVGFGEISPTVQDATLENKIRESKHQLEATQN